jgi:fibronectin type 3 domain-containing protein
LRKPSNLTATAASSSQINLSWKDNSDDEQGFKIERKTGAGGTYSQVATVPANTTTYSNTGLSPSTTYYYRVLAYSGTDNGGYSNEASATTSGIAPSAPTGLTASPSNASVTLSWAASAGATSYNVKRSSASGGPHATIATGVTTTSYINTGLANGTTYYYVVSAVNANGEGANSSEASATPLAPPAAPTGLTATAGNAQVSLTWTASAGATSYNVKRGTTAGGPYTTPVASGITTTSYTDTGLTNGTTYYYVVSAVNTNGESANSAQASATPSAPSPTGIVFRAAASASNGGGATTITINKPIGVVSGDCMIAALWVRGASAYGTITPPGGWTLIRNENWAGTDAIITYYKLAGASEPADYTWAFSTSEQLQGGIAAYYNVDQSAPVNMSAGSQAIYPETNLPAPSVIPTVSDTLLLCFFGSHSFPKAV